MKHYVLNLKKRPSGAYEHANELAHQLDKRGYETKHITHWWNESPQETNLKTKVQTPFNLRKIKNSTIHLQTHTYEHEGLLEQVAKNNKVLYTVHAIIPYKRMSQDQRELFLEGQLDYETIRPLIEEKIFPRERAQLSSLERAHQIITISQNHKKALELMGIRKPIHVFENVSGFNELTREEYDSAHKRAKSLRDKLQTTNLLLYCGMMSKEKSMNEVYTAFESILEKYPDAKLLAIGRSFKEREVLPDKGRFSEDKIVFVPWIDKEDPKSKEAILQYYLATDALVQPVLTEGLYAKTVIDAFDIGLPAITCKSPYSIGSSSTPQEILEAFTFIKENPKEVNRITNEAHEKVSRENTWDNYIERLLNL